MARRSRHELTKLLEQAKRAHASVDDDGHLWHDWYAAHLADAVMPLLGAAVDRGTLSAWLAEAEIAHARDASDSPWPEYYARFLLDAATAAGGPEEPR